MLLQLRYLINIGEDVACQGLYDRKYEIVYSDKTAGATASLTLWKKSRATVDELIHHSGEKIVTVCHCCTEYKQ